MESTALAIVAALNAIHALLLFPPACCAQLDFITFPQTFPASWYALIMFYQRTLVAVEITNALKLAQLALMPTEAFITALPVLPLALYVYPQLIVPNVIQAIPITIIFATILVQLWLLTLLTLSVLCAIFQIARHASTLLIALFALQVTYL